MNVSANASVSVNNGNVNSTASVNVDDAAQPNSNNSTPENSRVEPEMAKFAYEKAISAYQFHVTRYKDWMNLYAIFTGAMFIGLYNILDICPSFKAGCIPYIICLIGLIASVCWWMSQTGYYNWLLSWTEILHQREKDLFQTDTFVYSQIGDTYKTSAKNGRIPKFISTQKITSFFIQVIVFGWMVVITYLICKSCEGMCIPIISGLVLLGFYFGLRCWINHCTGWYSSTVGHMTTTIK